MTEHIFTPGKAVRGRKWEVDQRHYLLCTIQSQQSSHNHLCQAANYPISDLWRTRSSYLAEIKRCTTCNKINKFLTGTQSCGRVKTEVLKPHMQHKTWNTHKNILDSGHSLIICLSAKSQENRLHTRHVAHWKLLSVCASSDRRRPCTPSQNTHARESGSTRTSWRGRDGTRCSQSRKCASRTSNWWKNRGSFKAWNQKHILVNWPQNHFYSPFHFIPGHNISLLQGFNGIHVPWLLIFSQQHLKNAHVTTRIIRKQEGLWIRDAKANLSKMASAENSD